MEHYDVKIPQEAVTSIRNLLGVDKASLDLENGIITLDNKWDVQKLSEKLHVESVDEHPYVPTYPAAQLTEQTRQELDCIYSDKPYIGTIFEANFPGFSGYYVLVRNVSDKLYVIVNLTVETTESIITMGGISLTNEDVLFKNGHTYAKIEIRDNYVGLYEWLPAGSKVVGKIINLDKIQSIIDHAALAFPS